MDLHLVPGAEPTAAERAAVDAVLGPPRDGWDGGDRRGGSDGQHRRRRPRRPRRGATCCCRRCWRCRSAIGWISPGGLNYVCTRLTVPPADAYGVATFYALLAVEPRPPRVSSTSATTSPAAATARRS